MKNHEKLMWEDKDIIIRQPQKPLGILLYLDYKYESIYKKRKSILEKLLQDDNSKCL